MTQILARDDDAEFKALLRVLDDDAAAVDYPALDRFRDLAMLELANATEAAGSANVTQPAAELCSPLKAATVEECRSDYTQRGDDRLMPGLRSDESSSISDAPRTAAGPHDGHVTLTRVANEPPSRSSFWSTLVLAVVLGAAAASLWITSNNNSVASPLALASVLDDVSTADSLRIEAVLHGTQQEIVVKQPGKARWQVDATHYRLLDGTRLWRVDESENTAMLEPSPLLKGTSEKQARLDVLGVLGIDVGRDRRELIRALPVKEADVEGVPCSFYEATCDANVGGDVAGRVRIEAVVETLSRRMRTLTVWPAERRGQQPLADVRLLALNAPVEEEQFVLAQSLSQDGRIGKITDTQGVVTLRPQLHERWTPVCQQMLLKAGDSVRTDLRGPHAIKLTLTSDVQVTLGPGSLLECVSPFEVKLLGGEVQVVAPKSLKREFVLRGRKDVVKWAAAAASSNAEDEKTKATGKSAHPTRVYRVTREEKLVELQQLPAWLTGFEGATVGDKLGALICNVDGRNEPLSVGYHKVNVEIRDQIARTTIEESFVNHTGARLEGVFHFPLPSDASISGFGMWIGDQLVEADIVEKQRAREIYETILRERRDPGLLEWTAGNLFKARVFPIEPHSEKRVKIVYTQVLPLRGSKFRYSYGLQSDLLKLHPVRELAIDVLVNSTLPLEQVESPTHDVQKQISKHSAQLKFNAREFVPQRDFEVVCSVDGKQNDVVVVPHQRGDDGYLLVQITPPSAEGNWQREVVPNGAPAELLLLCDTSGSMDQSKRAQQAEFVAALLAALGEKDRFNLAGSDVNCVWAFPQEKSVPATAANIAAARKFLSERGSLGWTDLKVALRSAREKANAGSQVVYVGDGIETAGADWEAVATQVGKKNDTKTSAESTDAEAQPTLHAVAVGNVVEAAVLKRIAAKGGSMRAITGEMTPQMVALELLNELTQPGLRDLQIEFRGVPVAAVYPSKLPNVAAGTQQMVLARYLPGAGKGPSSLVNGQKKVPLEVVVTGKRGTETVTFKAKTNFAEAEDGNSFIPRLWARLHLDQLLSQGKSKAIQDEIIRLSEEFHIITPFTSLLVLETDADRERFGVKRRYEMRDGERYFADGRNNAKYDLRQQYMAAERAWREGLRRQVLKELAKLGRDPQVQRRLQQLQQLRFGQMEFAERSIAGENLMLFECLQDARMSADGLGLYGALGGGGGGGLGSAPVEELLRASEMDLSSVLSDTDGERQQLSLGDRDMKELSDSSAFEDLQRMDLGSVDDDFAEDMFGLEALHPGRPEPTSAPLALHPVGRKARHMPAGGFFYDGPTSGSYRYRGNSLRQRHDGGSDVFSLLLTVMPHLPQAAQHSDAVADTKLWSADALALSQKLSRKESLQQFLKQRGLEVRVASSSIEKRWPRTFDRSDSLNLISGTRWLTRPQLAGSHDVIQWCDQKERGAFSNAFGLGQVRKSEAFELQQLPLSLLDYSLTPLHFEFHSLSAKLIKVDDSVSQIELSNAKRLLTRVTINTRDAVVLRVDYFDSSELKEPRRTIVFSDFVDVAGRKLAQKCVQTSLADDNTETVTTTSYSVIEHDAAGFAARFKAESAGREQAEFLHLPLPSVKKAKDAIAAKKGSLEDRMVVLNHFARSQQWAPMFEQLEGIEALPRVKGSVGREWVRTLLLKLAGRNEEVRQRLLEVGRVVVQGGAEQGANADRSKSPLDRHALVLAQTIHNEAHAIVNWDEYARIIQLLKPVFDRQSDETEAKAAWRGQWINCLRSLGRSDELRNALVEQLKLENWHNSVHVELANVMASTGDFDAGRKYLEELRTAPKWNANEQQYFRDALLSYFRNHQRRSLAVEMLERELNSKLVPTDEQFYVVYLSELLLADQETRAHELMRQWMRESLVDGRLTPLHHARLDAAIRLVFGRGDSIYWGRIDERFMPDLIAVAKHFARHADHYHITSRILGQHPFGESDELIQLRGEWFGFLKASLKTLKVGHLVTLVNWVLPNEPVTTREEWASIATIIHERWATSKDEDDKHSLGATLEAIYGQRFDEARSLAFLREQLAAASAQYRESDRRRLFDALMRAKWSIEIEREAMTLLPQLGEQVPAQAESETTHDIVFQVISLHQFVDRMLAARQAAAMDELKANGHPEQLTRTQYAQKQAAFLKAAREGVAETLSAAAKASARTAATPAKAGASSSAQSLANWLALERGYFDVLLERNRNGVLAECWGMLGESPLPSKIAVDPTRSMQKQRAFVVVMNLICRRSATEAEIDRFLKYIDVGIAGAKPSDDDDAFDREAATYVWKKAKFDVLVALDRPEALERELRKWIKADSIVAPWRTALGRLKAERGDLKEAIELFEAVQRSDELMSSEKATLAQWYLAADRRADYERARVAQWETMQEHHINNSLYQLLQPYQQTTQPPPSTLDENVLFALRALFEKSNSPSSYLHQLRSFYDVTRDFRLLDMLPHAVVKKTPQKVYEVLNQLQHSILVELRDEATSDELLKRVKALRAEIAAARSTKGETAAVDLRALDLLEALVERKASEVLNQPGPHVAAALAAMKRAFDREWADGEQRQMAEFLSQLGVISQQPLIDEQLREIGELARQQQNGSDEQLFITAAWTRLLVSYGQRDRGLALLENAVREYERTHEIGWPAQANGPFTEYVNHLNAANRCSVAETLVLKHLNHPSITVGQREFFRHRLIDIYQHAYVTDQRVTLGEGDALLKKLHEHVLERAKQAHEGQRTHYLHAMSNLCLAAKDKHPTLAREFIRSFAFDELPGLLKTRPHDFESMISNVGEALKTLLDSRVALEFLIERLEQYPRSSFYGWNTPWQRHGHRVAELRSEVKSLGNLEARLLKLVLDELRADLRQRDNRSNRLFRKHDPFFWSEKKADFIKVSEEVLAERKESGQTAVYVSAYLYWIGEDARAIEILFDFHKRAGLREQGISQLVGFLHQRNRFAESIPLLEAAIKRNPDLLWYRLSLMTAYGATQRRQMLETLHVETDAHFRKDGRWNESVAAELGRVCTETGLREVAIGYLQEAIAMRLRGGPGVGDDALWNYYRDLSNALIGLKRTQEAVDAAAAGIVMWPTQHHRRQEALDNLPHVLRQAPDLDGYVKWLDEQVAKDGQERPAIRKAIGRVLRERNRHDAALVQLRLAADVTPNDRELQHWLLETLDQLGQQDAAIRQLKLLTELDARNLDWHKQLAERLSENEAEAERAATSIVEALPTEAESYQALAQIREGQSRWSEAVELWKKAAELRALEPTGLLGLANAQIEAKQFTECEATLDRLTKTKWDARFNDVKHRTEVLRAKLRTVRM